MTDYIDREKTIAHLKKRLIETAINNTGVRALCDSIFADTADNRIEPWINEIPNAEVEPVKRGKWIPCIERLPDNIRPVIVTWKNKDPESYYRHIVGKHFTGTACYKNGKWYWYSSITEDMLAEYGRYDSEEFDEAIECIAWMPLPKPYKGEGEEE